LISRTDYRLFSLVITTIAFLLLYAFLTTITWQGSEVIHTVMESVAATLSLTVGLMALVKFFSYQQKLTILVAVTFLGTAFLDGYHAVVTSIWFKDHLPSNMDTLVPWSWSASRMFLASGLLFACWITVFSKEAIADKTFNFQVYLTGFATTLFFFIFFIYIPLPQAYYPELIMGRPEELLPGILFIFAFAGLLKRNRWRESYFEFWLLHAILVNIIAQIVFMSMSFSLFDMPFDMAHLLKKISYIYVMIGLLVSMHFTFKRERKAKLLADNATTMKNDFLANMSHEIRTPMNAILGLCHLLDKQQMPAASKVMAQKIHKSAKQLLMITNDILDLSKIESHRLKLEYSPFVLSQLTSQIQSLTADMLKGKSVKFIIDSSSENPNFLIGDEARLTQVLINLVSNAIKYTSRGEVILRIFQEDYQQEDGVVLLNFAVIDTGTGMSAKKINSIFNAFTQDDASNAKNFGGSGLGLSISKSLVEMMGGSLSVKSALGQGCHFSFSLKFDLHEALKNHILEVQRQRVLYVSSDQSSFNTIDNLVKNLKWEVIQVANTGEALRLFTEKTYKTFNFFIVDWDLSSMQTLNDIEKLKALNHKAPRVIVATTHHHYMYADMENYYQVDRFVLKPVEETRLHNAILDLYYQHETSSEINESAQGSTNRLAGYHVLVVDDSDINRDVAEKILNEEGATVRIATDGEDAIEKLQNNQKPFNLILMDIQMPIMDGFKATQLIRQMSQYHDLPIIALTAGSQTNQRQEALQSGMNAFLNKPFEVDDLVNCILALKNGDMDFYQQLKKPLDHNNLTLEIDFEKGWKVWKNDEVFCRYLQKFIDDYGNYPAEFEHLDNDEAKSRLAHKIKGACGSMGIEPLMHITARVETALIEKHFNASLHAEMNSIHANVIEQIKNYIADKQSAGEADSALTANSISGDNESQAKAPLQQLSQALEADDLDKAEELLEQLDQLITGKLFEPVRLAIVDFDMDKARHELTKIAATLNLPLGV